MFGGSFRLWNFVSASAMDFRAVRVSCIVRLMWSVELWVRGMNIAGRLIQYDCRRNKTVRFLRVITGFYGKLWKNSFLSFGLSIRSLRKVRLMGSRYLATMFSSICYWAPVVCYSISKISQVSNKLSLNCEPLSTTNTLVDQHRQFPVTCLWFPIQRLLSGGRRIALRLSAWCKQPCVILELLQCTWSLRILWHWGMGFRLTGFCDRLPDGLLIILHGSQNETIYSILSRVLGVTACSSDILSKS